MADHEHKGQATQGRSLEPPPISEPTSNFRQSRRARHPPHPPDPCDSENGNAKAMKNTAADIALEFIDRINSHDIALIRDLMTADHIYIDAQGNQIHGQRPLERSW